MYFCISVAHIQSLQIIDSYFTIYELQNFLQGFPAPSFQNRPIPSIKLKQLSTPDLEAMSRSTGVYPALPIFIFMV
jgi:hypothetical protein